MSFKRMMPLVEQLMTPALSSGSSRQALNAAAAITPERRAKNGRGASLITASRNSKVVIAVIAERLSSCMAQWARNTRPSHRFRSVAVEEKTFTGFGRIQPLAHAIEVLAVGLFADRTSHFIAGQQFALAMAERVSAIAEIR